MTMPSRTKSMKNKIKNNNKKKEEHTEITESSDTQNSTTGFTTVKSARKPAPVALDLTTFKPLTAKWKSLDAHSKNLMPYMATDRASADIEIANALKTLEKHPTAALSRDAWLKIFLVSYSAKGKNKKKSIKHFGVRLAASDPKEFFLPHEFNGTKLLQGRLANAWAGAYIFYGPGWLPEISVSLDVSAGIDNPTDWWNSLPSKDVYELQPFGKDEIFSDDCDSMHDRERHLRLELGFDMSQKITHPKEWTTAFGKIKNTPGKARDTLLKLAVTPINVFSSDWFSDPGRTKMISASVTNFWIGAYRIAGGPWVARMMEDHPKKNDKANAKAEATPPKKLSSNLKKPKDTAKGSKAEGVKFDKDVKSRSLFISRSVRKPIPAKAKIKTEQRNHEDVYYSVECAPIDSDWKEAGAEITAHFAEVIEHIFKKDIKAIVHPWDSSGAPLSKKSDAIKNKIQVKRYVNSLWIRQGFSTKFRMRISHDVIPSLLELASEAKSLYIEHDHIQEKERTIIGFLVGSSPDAANLEDMREAHENHSVLYGLKLLAQDQAIKLVPGKNNIPWKLQTKAVHILVGASQAVDARDRYNRVFGSRNEGGYPQGLQMRFVPDISDARFPSTPSTRVKAVKMMSKQKVFQDNTKIIPTSTIAGLHTVVTKIGFSLCQILMAIKSNADKAMGLFISIDEQFLNNEYTTIFTVHKDRHDEAIGLIPLLCIIMVAKYGPSAWEWFNEDAKVVLLKYQWDTDAGKVVLIEPDDEDDDMELESDDEYMQQICDIYNVDSTQAGNGFEFNIDFLVADAAVSKNQYGDAGSVKTFREACVPMDETDDESIQSTPDPKTPRSPSPDSLTIDTDIATQATSNLTENTTPSDVANSLEQLMLQHPALAQSLWAKNSAILAGSQVNDFTKSTAISPNEGVDGN
jgi:hypothetical protein